ncbi:MAG: diguanylate cyclase [Lachnospiraceae bacterium]|nr:diguanylate cyclase [Lachnospiraceae bacterium]
MMKKSLKLKMLLLTILPLLFLALVMLLVSFRCFRNTMVEEARTDMSNQCHLLEQMFERMYPGEYRIEVLDGDNYRLYKGDYDITSSEDILDNLKESYGDELTIYCRDTSVLTTMTDENGERALLGKVSPIVSAEVLDQEEERFYSDVTLEKEKYFAYYLPILWEDGTCFGMFAVYRSAESLQKSVYRALLPVALVYLLATMMIGLISISYSQQIVVRIRGLQRFLGALSKGRFDGELSHKYLQPEDELSELGRSSLLMQDSLRRLVECDALTELNNRRYGDNRLKKILDDAGIDGADCCVAIGDIDFFKKVNDTYGHDAGDEVLRQVSRVLKKHMAGKGFVARWGGEEFLFVFEKQDLQASVHILWEMLEEIRQMAIQSGTQEIHVTMSYGVTGAWKKATADELLKTADERLYTAKTSGRNQVVGE